MIRDVTKRMFRHLTALGIPIIEGNSSLAQLEYLASLAQRLDARVVGEIGFLTGFSSIALLLSSPTLTVVSFDEGRHSCVKPAKEFIDEHFPGRHRLILGDSRETVPAYAADADNPRLDLVYIDGGHEYDEVTADVANCRSACAPGAAAIIDDLTPWRPWGEGPTRAWENAVRTGVLEPIEILSDGVPVPEIEGPADRIWALGRYA